MSHGQIVQLTSSARKLSSIYKKNVIRFWDDSVLFHFTNVIVSGSSKYAQENQEFTKNEWDWLGACMPFVMSPWPITSVSSVIHQFHVKQFFILLQKSFFPSYCHRS